MVNRTTGSADILADLSKLAIFPAYPQSVIGMATGYRETAPTFFSIFAQSLLHGTQRCPFGSILSTWVFGGYAAVAGIF